MKYKNQVISIVHKSQGNSKKQTLGVDSFLYVPSQKDYDDDISMPLEIHGKYSRFKLTLIDKKDEDKLFVSFNLDVQDIPKLLEDTKVYNQHYLMRKLTPSEPNKSNSSDGLAYTQKMTLGSFKGKTPAEILIADPLQKEILLKNVDFLKSNLSKYPQNQTLINAINEAIKLLDEGKLNNDTAVSQTPVINYQEIPVYSAFKIPSITTLDDNGYTKVNSFSITYKPLMKSPICLEITNCLAKPINNNALGVDMQSAIDRKTITMYVSMDEWYKVIEKMSRTKELFESIHAPSCFEIWKNSR